MKNHILYQIYVRYEKNVKKKSSAKREHYDENVFFKANRALGKLNLLFHLKSKTNSVTLRTFNSNLQYYKIDLSFCIILQEINLNVCEEHKTEREAWGPNRSERKAFALGALKFSREARDESE